MKALSGVWAGLALLWIGGSRSQVVVESLDRQGGLTWSNYTANATYRVEWASSVQGPWKGFDALTNLLSVRALTNVVTVEVPMFYRVVWLDAPEPDPVGEWLYWANDHFSGTLVSTGRMALWWTNFPGTNRTIGGTWSFRKVSGPEGPLETWGLLARPSYVGGPGLELDSVGAFDNNFYWHGNLAGDRYWGDWERVGFGGWLEGGTFVAAKVPAVK